MKKLILFLSLLFACSNNYAASPVWKVEHNGFKLYLAGTIHLLRTSDYPLPSGFDKAYKNSSVLVFETDIDALKTPALSNKLLASISLPKGQTLFSVIAPETQQLLQQYSAKNNISLDYLSHFKPSFVAITLALNELNKMGVSQTGVDEYYNNKAKTDHKPTLGLETPEQQIKILSNMAQGHEDEFIIQTLKDINDVNSMFDDMLLSWKQGNLNKIESFFIAPTKKQFPMMHKQLLVDRNQSWLAHLKSYLTTTEVEMVLVGSAHLAGKDGLLKTLKNMGYTITQLH